MGDRNPGIGDHVRPESAITMVRNTQWSKTDFDQEGTFTTLQSTRTTKDFSQLVVQMQFMF
jgi:hypothetical protein